MSQTAPEASPVITMVLECQPQHLTAVQEALRALVERFGYEGCLRSVKLWTGGIPDTLSGSGRAARHMSDAHAPAPPRDQAT